MKASVDETSCASCGLCESICPEVFRLHDDRISVRVGRVESEIRGSCREAMRQCPTEAITLEEMR